VDYISALREHKQKQSFIANFQHAPQSSFIVGDNGSVLNLDPH
jgi:hypothetical protein